MDSSFTVQLFDLLVYILPGLILFAGIWLLLKGALTSLDLTKAAGLVYVLLLSFLLGVLSHVIAGVVHRLVEEFNNSVTLAKPLREFGELERAKRLAGEKLRLSTDDVQLYFFAKIYVQDKLPGSSASISRLTALSIFCRNSAFPVLVLAAAATLQIYKKRKRVRGNWKRYCGILFATVAVQLLLLRGMLEYTEAMVHATLRAFIIALSG
jgi:hypothetical protein